MRDDIGTEDGMRVCAACGGAMALIKPWMARCGSCGFMTSSLEAGPGTGIDGLETLRRANFVRLCDRLERDRPLAGLRVLEAGSAKGWFLEEAATRGAVVRGIEPEAANAEIARAAGFEVEGGLFPDGLHDRGPYDLIVFNDVFEHIPSPGRIAGEIATLLTPGGRLVVNLPSSRGTFYRIARLLDGVGVSDPYERLWQMGFPSPHISYFDPDNLKSLVERHSPLQRTDAFSLPAVIRTGLRARIRSSHPGFAGEVLFAGSWLLTFALDFLPADCCVGVFTRPTA